LSDGIHQPEDVSRKLGLRVAW